MKRIALTFLSIALGAAATEASVCFTPFGFAVVPDV